MSAFEDSMAAADVSAFATMGDQVNKLTVRGTTTADISVIEQPPSEKGVFVAGGRIDDSENVLEVKVSDLDALGVSRSGFACVWKGKEYKCRTMTLQGSSYMIVISPNVNRPR